MATVQIFDVSESDTINLDVENVSYFKDSSVKQHLLGCIRKYFESFQKNKSALPPKITLNNRDFWMLVRKIERSYFLVENEVRAGTVRKKEKRAINPKELENLVLQRKIALRFRGILLSAAT